MEEKKPKVWEVLSPEERSKSEFRKAGIPVHIKPRESGTQKAARVLGQIGRGLADNVAPPAERIREPRRYMSAPRKRGSPFPERREGDGLGALGKSYWRGPTAYGSRSYYENTSPYFKKRKGR